MSEFTSSDIKELNDNIKIMEDLFESFLIEKLEADMADIADIRIKVKRLKRNELKLTFETIIEK